MRFDAVFFDSGGTLWRSPAPGTVPAGTSIDEVREQRFVRVAHALAGLGCALGVGPAAGVNSATDAGHVASAAGSVAADEVRIRAILPDLESSTPGRIGEAYTYIDLMHALGEALGRPLRHEDALLCADAYVGPRYACCLFPGTVETLAALSAAGLHLGIISNTYIQGYSLDRMLRSVGTERLGAACPAPTCPGRAPARHGMFRFFPTRIYSGDEGVSKPDLGIFRLAEQRTGFSGRRVLYVGDSVRSDIEPARAVGWSAALKRSSAATSNGLADFEFDETPELLPFVFGPRPDAETD